MRGRVFSFSPDRREREYRSLSRVNSRADHRLDSANCSSVVVDRDIKAVFNTT